MNCILLRSIRTTAVFLLFFAFSAFSVCAGENASPVITVASANQNDGQISSYFDGIATVSEKTGSGILKVELDEGADINVSLSAPGVAAKQGELIGYFTTTGFCTCALCTGGHGQGLTASGTKPKAGHTIAADTSRFPFGTRLMINGTVYTVEDEGSGVKGDWIDIYYDNHADAVAHGTKYGQAVYAVSE